MATKTPNTGGPGIAQGTPVIRRLLDSMEDGEEVDFEAWTDETRITNMDEQLKCCVIGEAAVEEKIKGYCARSGMAISITLKKKLGQLMHFSEDEEAGALPSCKGVFKNWSAYVLTPVTSMAGWTALLAHMVLYLEVLIIIRILELGGTMSDETRRMIESNHEYASLVVNDALEDFGMKLDAKTVGIWKKWQMERLELRDDLSEVDEAETVEEPPLVRRGAMAPRVEGVMQPQIVQPQVIQVRTATLGPALDHKLNRQQIDLHLKSILSAPKANKTHEALEARFGKNEEYTLRISNMMTRLSQKPGYDPDDEVTHVNEIVTQLRKDLKVGAQARLTAVTRAALEFKQNKTMPAETYFHKARILYEAVYAEVDGVGELMDPKLRCEEAKCQTACEGLLPQIRGIVMQYLADVRRWGVDQPGMLTHKAGFSDWDVMTDRVTEISANHSIDPKPSSGDEVRFSDGGGKGGGRGRGGGGGGGGRGGGRGDGGKGKPFKYATYCHELDQLGVFTEGDGCKIPGKPKDKSIPRPCMYTWYGYECKKKRCIYSHDYARGDVEVWENDDTSPAARVARAEEHLEKERALLTRDKKPRAKPARKPSDDTSSVTSDVSSISAYTQEVRSMQAEQRKLASEQQKFNGETMAMFKTISDKIDSIGDGKPFSMNSF